MLGSGPIQERSFPSWQMGAKKFEESSIEYQTDMSHAEQEEFKSILSGSEKEGNRAIILVKKFFK